MDETAQFQSNLPAVPAQAVQVRAEQPGLLFLRTEQCLCYERKGGQPTSLFGNGQSHVGGRTFLGEERAPERAPEKSSEQLGPALVRRRLAGLHCLRRRGSLCRRASLRRRANIEGVEAQPEPRAKPQGSGTGRGSERPVLPFGVKHPAVPPENLLPPDEGSYEDRFLDYRLIGCLLIIGFAIAIVPPRHPASKGIRAPIL